MDYNQFKNTLQTLLTLTDQFGGAAFNATLPRLIEDAEGRIFNDPDMDFLWQRLTDTTQVTSNQVRSVPIPATVKIIETVNLILPANTQPSEPDARRVQLLRVTRPVLDVFWPVERDVQTPKAWETFYAIYGQDEGISNKVDAGQGAVAANADVPADAAEPGNLPSAILIGPTPDGQYVVEFAGVGRPAPISADNQTTILSATYPELLIAAGMVFGCALLKNWSAQAEDPRAAISWEKHFQDVKAVVTADANRQKSLAPGFTPSGPSLYPPRPQAA